jgi:hypothetical protein
MKYMQAVLAVVGIFVISGAIAPAQADDDKRSVTLYTSALRATGFNCNAVNVSRKTLTITTSIIDLDGIPLAVSPPTPTARDTEASNDVDTSPTPTDAYCKFEVVGRAIAMTSGLSSPPSSSAPSTKAARPTFLSS